MTIKEARQSVGLTQKGVTDFIGIPLRTLQDWEYGKRKCPDWCERLVIKEILTYKSEE